MNMIPAVLMLCSVLGVNPQEAAPAAPGASEGFDEASEDGAAGEPIGTAVQAYHYEKKVAGWTDPATVPHTKFVCTKWGSAFHHHFCIGGKVETQTLEVELFLVVDAPDVAGIQAAVATCVEASAVASVLVGLGAEGVVPGSGVQAAEATIAPAFKACLIERAGEAAAGLIKIDTRTHWSDYH